ncbi:MAG: hypothetical protein LBS56_09470 [Propionibacteriaceae bacterium]|jgi:hypothetical protein|nr:hypothetical protein [Propionibacteriaceae bacterium]
MSTSWARASGQDRRLLTQQPRAGPNVVLTKRVRLSVTIYSTTLVSPADIPGVRIVAGSYPVIGCAALQPGILIVINFAPDAYRFSGMQAFVLMCMLGRFWRARNMVLGWAPTGADLTGNITIVPMAPEDAATLADHRGLEGVADGATGVLGRILQLQIADPTSLLWAASTGAPGLYPSPAGLPAARRDAIRGTSAAVPVSLVCGITDFGEAFHDRPQFALGEVYIEADVDILENIYIRDLPFPLAALLPDYHADAADIHGSTRTSAKLCTRCRVLDSAAAEQDRLAHNPLFRRVQLARLLRGRPRELAGTTMNFWPNVVPFLGQLGRDLVAKFTSTGRRRDNAISVLTQYAKIIHQDGSDPSGTSEFPLSALTFAVGTLSDSVNAAVSDAAVQATFLPGWDTWKSAAFPPPLNGVHRVTGTHKSPVLGVSCRMRMSACTFDDTDEINMFATGISPQSGAFAGPAVTRGPADGGQPNLGILLQYKKLGLGRTTNGIFSTAWGLIKGVGAAVLPAACGVVQTLVGQRGVGDGTDIPVKVAAVTIAGDRDVYHQGKAISVPQAWYPANWEGYRADRPQFYSTSWGASAEVPQKNATLVLHYGGTLLFGGAIGEIQTLGYPGLASPGRAKPADDPPMRVAAMGPTVHCILSCALFWTHCPARLAADVDPFIMMPLKLPGQDRPEVSADLPWFQLVNTPVAFEGTAVGAICPVALELGVEGTLVITPPREYLLSDGTVGTYAHDEAIAFFLNAVPQITVAPDYGFMGVGGGAATEGSWIPEPIVVCYNHAHDLIFDATSGTATLGSYGDGWQKSWPIGDFPRAVLKDGKVTTDALPPDGGFEFQDIRLEVSNEIEADAADQAP